MIQSEIDRIAAGVMPQPPDLTDDTRALITRRRAEIAALRRARSESRSVPLRALASAPIRWRGVQIIAIWSPRPPGVSPADWVGAAAVRYRSGLTGRRHYTKREAAREVLRNRCVRRFRGGYYLCRVHERWRLFDTSQDSLWDRRPTRNEIAATIRRWRSYARRTRLARPDPNAPDTLGWRYWFWADGSLVSPYQQTPWETPELIADEWSDSEGVRGECGIHARRMPLDWRRALWEHTVYDAFTVTGIVERFGRYVLGSEGWRAEWVVIRELQAPSVEIMLALMQRYPDVRVHLSPYAEEV